MSKLCNLNILILSFLLFFFLLFFYGCFGTRKIKTKTITETVIRIDTIIKFIPDTVPVLQYVRITDTAYIENKTAIAKSYYSTQKQRIVLELSGKKFNVPVTMYKKVTQVENTKVKEPVNKIKWFWWIFAGVIITLVIIDRKEIFK